MPKGGNARTQPPSHHENAILLDRFTRDPVLPRLRHGFGTTRYRACIQPAIGGPLHSVGPPVDRCPSCAELPASTIGPTDAYLPSGTDCSADVYLPSGTVSSPCAVGPAHADHSPDANVSAGRASSGPASGDAAPGRPAEYAASNAAEREGKHAAADAGSNHPTADAFPDAAECDAIHAAGIQAVDPAGLHDHAFGDS